MCRFCGSVGHASSGKCNYCEIGCVDRLEKLPQKKAWRGALQRAGILSASQLRKQVAKGRCVPCRGCGAFRVKDAKQQCLVCGSRPPRRHGAARKRFVVGFEHTSRWRCSACSSEGRRHRGSCKHFRTCGGKYTVPTIQGSLLNPSDEEGIWQQTAQVGSSDGASRRMAGAPSKMALATGRDFCEDGVGDEEESCMPSPSESSLAEDNLDEAEQ